MECNKQFQNTYSCQIIPVSSNSMQSSRYTHTHIYIYSKLCFCYVVTGPGDKHGVLLKVENHCHFNWMVKSCIYTELCTSKDTLMHWRLSFVPVVKTPNCIPYCFGWSSYTGEASQTLLGEATNWETLGCLCMRRSDGEVGCMCESSTAQSSRRHQCSHCERWKDLLVKRSLHIQMTPSEKY